jgi:hypothetical protein
MAHGRRFANIDEMHDLFRRLEMTHSPFEAWLVAVSARNQSA